jgi:hypothetical protein
MVISVYAQSHHLALLAPSQRNVALMSCDVKVRPQPKAENFSAFWVAFS